MRSYYQIMEGQIISSNCSYCKTTDIEIEIYCPKCGYPENGTEKEERDFRLRLNSRKLRLKDANKKLKTAKIVLYVLIGFSLLGATYYYFVPEDFASAISSIVVAIVYLGLLSWVDKNPFAALLSALIFYVTLQVMGVLIEPASIFKGLIIKIVVISALIKGVSSAQQVKQIRGQF